MVNEGLLTNSKLVELLRIGDHYQSQFHKYPYDIQKKGWHQSCLPIQEAYLPLHQVVGEETIVVVEV